MFLFLFSFQVPTYSSLSLSLIVSHTTTPTSRFLSSLHRSKLLLLVTAISSEAVIVGSNHHHSDFVVGSTATCSRTSGQSFGLLFDTLHTTATQKETPAEGRKKVESRYFATYSLSDLISTLIEKVDGQTILSLITEKKTVWMRKHLTEKVICLQKVLNKC